jgi:hypothetical protein
MKHYLFIGGVHDGYWEQATGRPSWSVAIRRPTPPSFRIREDVGPNSTDIHEYTYRRIHLGQTYVEVYALSSMSDRHVLTRILSIYSETVT